MRTATLNSEMEVLMMPESPPNAGTPSSVESKINVTFFKLLHLGIFYWSCFTLTLKQSFLTQIYVCACMYVYIYKLVVYTHTHPFIKSLTLECRYHL